MARPKTGNTVKDVTLTLGVEIIPVAQKRAFDLGISLSALVDRLLIAEVSTRNSIAEKYPRRFRALQPR